MMLQYPSIKMTSTTFSSPILDSIIDRLYSELSVIKAEDVKFGPIYVRADQKDTIVFDSRKYYDRAINYQQVLILAAQGKPIPSILLSLSDLSQSIKKDLSVLSKLQLEYVLKATILRIFHDINDDYNSVILEERFHIQFGREIETIIKIKLVP